MSLSQLDELYREVILDHHREPRGRHDLSRVDVQAEGYNPLCGDEVAVALEIDGRRISDVAVHGQGCAISTASGSMLAELLRGATVDRAEEVAGMVQALLRGDAPPELLCPAEDHTDTETDLGDLEALGGVRQFPARIKCAALPWVTLKDALRAQREKRPGGVVSTEGYGKRWQ